MAPLLLSRYWIVCSYGWFVDCDTEVRDQCFHVSLWRFSSTCMHPWPDGQNKMAYPRSRRFNHAWKVNQWRPSKVVWWYSRFGFGSELAALSEKVESNWFRQVGFRSAIPSYFSDEFLLEPKGLIKNPNLYAAQRLNSPLVPVHRPPWILQARLIS